MRDEMRVAQIYVTLRHMSCDIIGRNPVLRKIYTSFKYK